MALIAFTLISGMAMASDNKKTEVKKENKTVCNKKDCKDQKENCSKSCTPPACSKKC